MAVPGGAGESIGNAYVKIMADGRGMPAQIRKEIAKAEPGVAAEGRKAGHAYDEAFMKEYKAGNVKRIGEMVKELRKLEHEYNRIIDVTKRLSAGERLANSTRRETRREINLLVDGLRDFNKEAGVDNRVEIDRLTRINRELAIMSPSFHRINGSLDNFSSRMGRAFGRGSRNNALHFFGGIVEGGARLIALVPRLLEGAFSIVKAFKFDFAAGGGGLQGLQAAFKGLSGAAAAGVPGLIAVAVGFAAVTVLIGPLVSGLFLLVGVFAALASTVTFAALGALGALAGAILPVVAGIAVLVAGIASMDDAAKKSLKNSIKPLTDEFKRLGDIAADEIFANSAEQASRLGSALKGAGLEPLVRGVAVAIRDVGDGFIDAVSGPGFKRFVEVMSDNLPGQIRKLGAITTNVFGGMAGLFIALQPLVNRFLTWLEKVTGEFSVWANEAEGQKKLTEFFERAGDSARSLGGFLKQVVILLAEIFGGGNEAGNNIFDSMAESVKGWTQSLRENPEAIKQFFEDAQELAGAIGKVVEVVGKLIDALDTPANRTIFIGILEAVVYVVETVSQHIALFFEGMSLFFEGVGSLFQWVMDLIEGFPGAVGEAFSSVGMLFESLLGTVAASTTFIGEAVGGMASGLASNVQGVLAGALSRAGTAFDRLRGTAGEAASTLAGRVQGAFGALGEGAGRLGGMLAGGLASGFDRARGAASNTASTLAGRLGSALSAVRSGAERVGSFFAGTLSSAFSGFRGVVSAVDRVLGGIRGVLNSVADAARSLARALSNIKVPNIRLPSLGSLFSARGSIMGPEGMYQMKKMASGGFANYAQNYIIGESGREAIVPLDRPLSLVDPSVRDLAAFAQGKGGNIDNSRSRTIDVGGITVVSNSDPRAVAVETVNELVGLGF